MHTHEMLDTSPTKSLFPKPRIVACIDACFDCAQSCTACADACLGEPKVDMLRRCIRLNMDCAAICVTTGQVLSRQHDPDVNILRSQLQACLVACQACGDECAQHASMHEHCRICAEACKACATACQQALDSLGGRAQGNVRA